MKATGMVRQVDELGRIVIPIELRRTLGIDVKDSLEIYVDGPRIILKKYQPGCTFCGDLPSDDDLHDFRGHQICTACKQELARASLIRS